MARFSIVAAALALAFLSVPPAQGLAPEQAISFCTTVGDVCVVFHDAATLTPVTTAQTNGPVVAVQTWVRVTFFGGPFAEFPTVTTPTGDPCAIWNAFSFTSCIEVGPRISLRSVTSGPVVACLVTVLMDVRALGHTVLGNVPALSVHTPPDC